MLTTEVSMHAPGCDPGTFSKDDILLHCMIQSGSNENKEQTNLELET